LDVVNGGPLLVVHARPFVDAVAEGFVQPDLPSFYYGFGVRRNPRTMAGVSAAGDVLLVTVDGRQPGYSVGLSFAEEAAVMRALGAVEALNLDGGGSTTMVAGGRLLGRPSDATGERPVGDGFVVQPASHWRQGGPATSLASHGSRHDPIPQPSMGSEMGTEAFADAMSIGPRGVPCS
jgi:Phosphodiester glycosidase